MLRAVMGFPERFQSLHPPVGRITGEIAAMITPIETPEMQSGCTSAS